VQEVVLGANAHQGVAFEKLVETLNLQPDSSRNPLFQVMFVFHDELHPEFDTKTTVCDLTLELSETPNGLIGNVQYATDLFETATIDRLIGHFQTLLEGIVAHPEAKLSELPLLTESEYQQLLVAWNATTVELPDAHVIHSLFEQQVERTPQAVAAGYQTQHLTYSELNAKANQLAHYLRAIGVGSEARVGICVERSLDMVVGLLAILKAGGACVPLDPAYPEERLAFMLQDSSPVALLTQGKFAVLFADIAETLPIIDLHETVALWANQPVSNLNSNEVGLNPESLAYIIYTSGSTGKPKGTCVLHKGLQNLIAWHIDESRLSSNDAVLIVTSCAYVFTQRAIFSALLAGARLVLANEPFEPQAIMDLLVKEHVSLINITQSGLNALINVNADGHLSRLRRITLAGEPMNPSQLLALSTPRPEIVNNYGATECAGTAIYYQVPPDLEHYRNRSMPIGKPIWNTRIYILDSHQKPVPIGVAGEIHISGAPVGRGYLNQPEMTAERFVRDPFSAQADAMMYKTGDLGRWLADGTIEYRGRNDFQVKIRGFRVELGEIESALRQHPQLREAVVGVYERVSGDKHLAAYVVPQRTVIPTPSELRDFLKPHLPEFMIPSAFVFLDALPLTPNGKLDRKALPAPDQTRTESERPYMPPRSPIEEILVAIWQDVLTIERIGIDDNFFELGGHSLLAIQLLVRINKRYQIELPLSSLFEAPTVAELSVKLETLLKTPNAMTTPIIHQEQTTAHSPEESDDNSYTFPTSFAQQRLWFLDRLLGASGNYNISWAVQLSGELNVSALQQSLAEIVARHEVLRTYFIEQDAEAVQVIMAALPFKYSLMDLSLQPQEHSEVQAILDAEANEAFDLKQAPLIRALLIKLSDQDHVLMITIHHIVSDGWSMGVFRQELSSLYTAFSQGQASTLAELPIQYADYAVWQREWLQGEVLEKQISYWKTQLAELSTLELPTDKPRPKQPSYQGGRETLHLSAELTQGLKTLSQRQNVTLFMTLLAAFQLLLHRYSRQDDIVVGTAIAGRNQQEIENLIGFFVNTLVLRTDLSGSPSFNQLLSRVREVCLSAYAHQDMPFEKLVAELQVQRDMSRHPLFQVMFVLQPTSVQDMQLPELTLTKLTVTKETAKFDLGLSLVEHADGMTGTLQYSTDLFTADTITRLASHFETLLTTIVAHPDTAIADLPLLTAAERQQLLIDWNATDADYPKECCLHELFEQQVVKTPQAIAVVYEGTQLTYAELNAQANQLAHHLRELGVKPEVMVAICVQRSLNMLVGLLAVLKAGGTYVPLNPAYPIDLLTTIIEDSTPIALLTHSKLEHLFVNLANTLPVIDLDAQSSLWANQPSTNLNCHDIGLTPTHLAYIIYTSGSTGKPKGVMIEHSGVCSMITDIRQRYSMSATDRMLQFSPIAFDVSVQEIFITLSSGAGLVLRSDDWTANSDNWLSGANNFWALCEKNKVTVVKLPTAFWQQLIQEQQVPIPATIRLNIIGGEAVNSNILTAWFARKSYRPTLFNAYGPTETTVNSTIQETSANALSFQAIGRPIANTRLYILDATKQPVPIGVAGELYIGGVGVARGYLKRPDLTAEQFVADLFSKDPNARLYKTGDLVRWLADGTIEYLGRNDFQVKIRGFRIELGHIEAKLLEHPAVREIAVLVNEDGGVKRLVAYLVLKDNSVPTIAELRDFLKDRMPEFMIPSAFMFLDALPLTPNGKLNRKALPAPDTSLQTMDAGFVAPRNEVEQRLADSLGNTLGIDRVGIHDNFFELGGHSLLAVKFIVEVNKLFDIDLPLGAFYQSPTIEALGNIISSGEQQPSWYSLVPIQTQGSRPPLFAVHTVILEDLTRHLGKDQPLYFLRYGMAAVISNQSLQLPALEELASHYIKEMQQVQPQGPYYLIGFSFGGMIAYEMACQLRANGHQVNLVGLLDTYLTQEKQKLPYHQIIQKFLKLKPNQLLDLVKDKIDYLQTKKNLDTDTDFNPLIYALGPDLACRNGYQLKTYNERVTLFQASDRESMFFTNIPPEQAWKELLGDKLEVQQVTGSHLELCVEPHVKILAEKIIACMDKAMGGAL
jgi:amino acid adenylation domain-containing protein